ncbi:MAG: hydroxypyruvate isomerase family protein [Actinomycetes bacterium]
MTNRLPYEVNCSILFTELPVNERAAAAKAAGFDGVEFWWPFSTAVPDDRDVDAFVTSIQDAGVQLVGLNFFAGDMPGGDRGLVSWPARSSEFRDNIDVTIGIGERLGCKAFNALYGNRVDDATPEEQDALATENLSLAAAAADRIGGVVLIEAVSGTESYPLKLASDAIDVIDRVERASGAKNLAFLNDLYHLSVNGDDLDRVIDKYTSRTGHVQIADDPGRGQPGTGNLDIEGYLDKLADAGYDGWVGLEYKATTPSTDESFEWLPRDRRGA